MKPIPVYSVTEITIEEWLGAFAPQQKEQQNDHIYPSPVQQGTRSGERRVQTIQFTLQIVGPVGKTNHLNITIAQLNAIQEILEPVVTELKTPLRPMTKRQADILAKFYSKKYLTFWYVREVHPGQFEPWAHDLNDGLTVSSFYCGDAVNIIDTES